MFWKRANNFEFVQIQGKDDSCSDGAGGIQARLAEQLQRLAKKARCDVNNTQEWNLNKFDIISDMVAMAHKWQPVTTIWIISDWQRGMLI